MLIALSFPTSIGSPSDRMLESSRNLGRLARLEAENIALHEEILGLKKQLLSSRMGGRHGSRPASPEPVRTDGVDRLEAVVESLTEQVKCAVSELARFRTAETVSDDFSNSRVLPVLSGSVSHASHAQQAAASPVLAAAAPVIRTSVPPVAMAKSGWELDDDDDELLGLSPPKVATAHHSPKRPVSVSPKKQPPAVTTSPKRVTPASIVAPRAPAADNISFDLDELLN